MERNIYLKLTSLEEARSLWLNNLKISPLKLEKVSLDKARGRILGKTASAYLSSPAFHGAAMDGIAVKAEDTYGASETRPKELKIGDKAFWINTGQPLPENTNAVIMIENVIEDIFSSDKGEGERVTIEKAAFPWQHVRKMGEDMVATEILLSAGTKLGAYELGALAAAGVLEPYVFEKPRVLIIPTGSELMPVDKASPDKLKSGQALPEFNSLILSSLVEDMGGEAIVHDILPDDPDKISQALTNASQAGYHLIAINAGSSAGSHDYTPEMIRKNGELWVHGISIMPGKPTALGLIGKTPIIGVPGYPVSAIISFEELAEPLMSQWQGRAIPDKNQVEALAFQALPSRPGMEEFIRVKLGRVDDSFIAVPMPRGAGTVTSLSRADGVIRISREKEGIGAGERVPVSLIKNKSQIDGALLAIGSHDNTLDLLDSLIRKAKPAFSLASAHVGSTGGLKALKNGNCHLAASHLLNPQDGVYNQQAIKEYLPGVPVMQVRLVDREQGLMVAVGNPLNIKSIQDLIREDISFINRQRGSGTRVLLDWQLAELGISSDNIKGYENEEFTHMNVAVSVMSGLVSCGLGVKSAANALGLDFIPVGVEEYDLIIPLKYAEDERISTLFEIIRDDEFKKLVKDMGGYSIEKTGEIIWEFHGR